MPREADKQMEADAERGSTRMMRGCTASRDARVLGVVTGVGALIRYTFSSIFT
jgi:hypothetical protein